MSLNVTIKYHPLIYEHATREKYMVFLSCIHMCDLTMRFSSLDLPQSLKLQRTAILHTVSVL